MKSIIRVMLLAFAIVAIVDTRLIGASLFNHAKITVKVIDEQGLPVENATVRLRYETDSLKRDNSVDGVTKSDGTFSGSASTTGRVGYAVIKSGYYDSWDMFEFRNLSSVRWEPWNPEVTITLRKIENPVSMYARDTNHSEIEIPVTGKDVGFDLTEFDWVKPYGKGKNADIKCNLYIRRTALTDYEYRVKITFPGQFNGVQSVEERLDRGSYFKLPRFAPEDGYKKELTVFIDRKPDKETKESFKKNMNYIFRIRSEVEKGKLKRAMYGKILGDFNIGTKKDGNAYLQFKYYLNPDYTRNLEFDPKGNLFGDLPLLEQRGMKGVRATHLTEMGLL